MEHVTSGENSANIDCKFVKRPVLVAVVEKIDSAVVALLSEVMAHGIGGKAYNWIRGHGSTPGNRGLLFTVKDLNRVMPLVGSPRVPC